MRLCLGKRAVTTNNLKFYKDYVKLSVSKNTLKYCHEKKKQARKWRTNFDAGIQCKDNQELQKYFRVSGRRRGSFGVRL